VVTRKYPEEGRITSLHPSHVIVVVIVMTNSLVVVVVVVVVCIV